MKRPIIKLKQDELDHLLKLVKTGKKTGKELERAYVLLALHNDKSYADIEEFYYTNRTTIWRIAKNYIIDGLNSVLKDKARTGQPKKYSEKTEAEVIAMACSEKPKGRKRWTVRLLTEHLKKVKGLEGINRESVRLILKKTNINLG
jgi:putative transposase